MLLAELTHREGVFDWLASHAVRAARGSRATLFTLVHAIGILVMVFLSNEATAVVRPPAVYAAVKKAKVRAGIPRSRAGNSKRWDILPDFIFRSAPE